MASPHPGRLSRRGPSPSPPAGYLLPGAWPRHPHAGAAGLGLGPAPGALPSQPRRGSAAPSPPPQSRPLSVPGAEQGAGCWPAGAERRPRDGRSARLAGSYLSPVPARPRHCRQMPRTGGDTAAAASAGRSPGPEPPSPGEMHPQSPRAPSPARSATPPALPSSPG